MPLRRPGSPAAAVRSCTATLPSSGSCGIQDATKALAGREASMDGKMALIAGEDGPPVPARRSPTGRALHPPGPWPRCIWAHRHAAGVIPRLVHLPGDRRHAGLRAGLIRPSRQHPAPAEDGSSRSSGRHHRRGKSFSTELFTTILSCTPISLTRLVFDFTSTAVAPLWGEMRHQKTRVLI